MNQMLIVRFNYVNFSIVTKFHNTKWQNYVVKSNYNIMDVMNIC